MNALQGLQKAAHDAPGLPDRKRFTSLPTIPKGKGATWPMVVQRHKADRAGLHHDLRFGDRKSGVAHSWAYRSGKMPRVGERIEVHQQPDHTLDYMKFRGKIRDGYGKGSVGIARSGTVEVVDSSPDKFHFRQGRRRFVIVKTPRYGERSWLLIGLPRRKKGEKVAVHRVPTPDLADELLKAASKAVEEQKTQDRAVGQGIGSAATHFATGYAAAPLLYAHKKKQTLTHAREAKSISETAKDTLKGLGRRFSSVKRVRSGLRRYYGREALKPALALTAVALVGGMAKERIQAGYENWAKKRRAKTAEEARPYPGCAKCMSEPADHCSKCRQHVVTDWKSGMCGSCGHQNRFAKAAEMLEGFVHAAEDEVHRLRSTKVDESREKSATGLLLYAGSPSERPTSTPPKPTKGFAKHFGNRFNPSASEFRHAERGADDWMSRQAEFVDLGRRPNLVRAAQEVLQIEPGKPIPRAKALQMVRERRNHRGTAVTRRRAGVLKGMDDAADSPEDVKELLDALDTALKHPRVRYIELTEKN